MRIASFIRTLAASAAAATLVISTIALNPQPLPPGGDMIQLNPQPLPPGGEFGLF